MNSQIAQTTKGPIEYTLLGTGSMVLVCHGISSNCFSTSVAEPLVEAGFQVLTPSRPGYGRTLSNVGKTTEQAAEALIALLDSLSVQTCAVYAISGGGPTGIALAARYPQQVTRLILAGAISRPENRKNELNYQNQMSFYGPMHGVMWGILGIIGRLSPQSMARQTMTIFSTHDPADSMSRLTSQDIDKICRFYQGQSSRQGALNDSKHTVGVELLRMIKQPTLVVHSREDNSVPFSHAEWSLKNIPNTELCEAGFTGHFFWIGPDFPQINQRMVKFLTA
jgi:pimeloyl-ACP methyl ester carboxylesterase